MCSPAFGRGERGVVDDALAKLELQRTVVLTTPRFLAVPFLVARAPLVVTMHARLARVLAERARAEPQPAACGVGRHSESRCFGTRHTTTILPTRGCVRPSSGWWMSYKADASRERVGPYWRRTSAKVRFRSADQATGMARMGAERTFDLLLPTDCCPEHRVTTLELYDDHYHHRL